MIDFSSVKSISIPEGVVTKIVSAGKTLWQAVTYKNWVPYSLDSGGTSIYNGGLGYKDGYRLRSGGAEAPVSYITVTGFIPFKQGDVLRIYPAFTGLNTQNTVNFSDASFNNLGQYTGIGNLYGICVNDSAWAKIETRTDGVSVIDISGVSNGGNIAYVRIGNNLGNETPITSGSEMIVTINEEIK